jgi:hypothetical protein
MADQEINIKLNGIAQIRSELKALKGELANATDPKQMAALGEKAGALSDQLKDANEQAAIFASGSRFEQTSNAFGLMKSQLMSMDFEGAATSAKLFAGSLGKIDGKTISASLKGIGSTVASVGGAFLKLGAQLLLNPIFLLVTIIGAVVAAFVYLGNKLGWFEGVITMLTAVFRPLVDMIKWLLDALGLTSFAAEESLEKTTQQLEKEKEKRQEVIQQMDYKIALIEAEGKSTLALRIEKNKYFQEEIANQAKLLEFMDNSFLNQTKLYKETVKANKDKAQEIKVEEVKLNQEVIAEGKKAAEAQKQFLADRLSATRLIQDLTLGVMEDGVQKELETNRLKYERLQEDLLNNKKFNDEERIKLNALYVAEAEQTASEINKKYVAAEAKKNEELAAKRKEEQDKIIEGQDALFSMRQALSQTDQEAAIAQIVADSEAKLALEGITAEDEVLIAKDTAQKIADIEKEARDKKAAEEKSEFDRKMKMAEDYAGSVNNLAETVFTISNRFGKQDEESKEKRAKRQFQIQKAMSLSMAIIDGFKAANASLAQSPIALGPAPNPAGIASLAFAISTSLANVAKIASTQYGGKGGAPAGGSGGAAVGGADATAGGGAPSFSLFGQGNNQNTTSAAQDVESNNNQLTVKAIVVESDVTSTQNKVKKMQENATL